MPGVNAPNVAAGAPSVSDSVAGTVPPTSPATGDSIGPSAVGLSRSPGWQWCGEKNVEPGDAAEHARVREHGARRTFVACSNA